MTPVAAIDPMCDESVAIGADRAGYSCQVEFPTTLSGETRASTGA